MPARFTIIGGGIAGLTTAIALQRAGIETTIFEAAPEIKAIGAGLALSANALKAFNRLGLMEAVMEQGRLLDIFTVYDQKGKPITRVDSKTLGEKYGTCYSSTNERRRSYLERYHRPKPAAAFCLRSYRADR